VTARSGAQRSGVRGYERCVRLTTDTDLPDLVVSSVWLALPGSSNQCQ